MARYGSISFSFSQCYFCAFQKSQQVALAMPCSSAMPMRQEQVIQNWRERRWPNFRNRIGSYGNSNSTKKSPIWNVPFGSRFYFFCWPLSPSHVQNNPTHCFLENRRHIFLLSRRAQVWETGQQHKKPSGMSQIQQSFSRHTLACKGILPFRYKK